MKEKVKVLCKTEFSWIFQRTDRGMPSISIQGDSLGNLVSQVAAALDAIENRIIDDEVEAELRDAFETLDKMYSLYLKHGLIER